MTTKPRFPDTGESDLPRELVDLAQKIADLPEPLQKDLETAYSRVVESVRRRRRILALVQEAALAIAARHQVPDVRSGSHPQGARRTQDAVGTRLILDAL